MKAGEVISISSFKLIPHKLELGLCTPLGSDSAVQLTKKYLFDDGFCGIFLVTHHRIRILLIGNFLINLLKVPAKFWWRAVVFDQRITRQF